MRYLFDIYRDNGRKIPFTCELDRGLFPPEIVTFTKIVKGDDFALLGTDKDRIVYGNSYGWALIEEDEQDTDDMRPA